MRYFSTFSGIGGFELGIEQAYAHYLSLRTRETPSGDGAQTTSKQCLAPRSTSLLRQWDPSNTDGQSSTLLDSIPTCIGYSEIDRTASSIYNYHWPNHLNYGDITTINPTDLADFDLLVGGFPCQAFSVAGRRKGFSDRRGQLFFEIARIIRQKQPRFLLLENVKGLLSHDQGKTFSAILTTLDDLGYDVQWQVLNSKDFGVPQNRQRVYIMGNHRNQPRPQIFPLGQTETLYHSSRTVEKGIYAATLTARQFASWNGNYIKVNSCGEQTISHVTAQPFVQLTETRTEEAKRIRKESMKQGKDWSPRRATKLVPRTDGLANTLTTSQGRSQLLTNGTQIRRLTPLECERLQGFPDGWTAKGIKDGKEISISDSKRYKVLGNAVTVNVVAAIMKYFFEK